MRLFTTLLIPAALVSLGSVPSIAVAGTMLAASSARGDCGFAASTGDSWMGHSTGSSPAGGAATGGEPTPGGSGCRTAGHRVAVDATPRPSAAMVPDSSTWMMMIGGFVLIGLGMRDRKRTFSGPGTGRV